MARIVFQGGGKAIERAGGVALFGLDNAKIAIGVGDTILLFNGSPI